MKKIINLNKEFEIEGLTLRIAVNHDLDIDTEKILIIKHSYEIIEDDEDDSTIVNFIFECEKPFFNKMKENKRYFSIENIAQLVDEIVNYDWRGISYIENDIYMVDWIKEIKGNTINAYCDFNEDDDYDCTSLFI